MAFAPNRTMVYQMFDSENNRYGSSTHACWASMGNAYLRGKVLSRLEWHAEANGNASEEELIQLLEHFFPEEDKYHIKWEIRGRVEDQHTNTPGKDRLLVVFTEFGDYPRQLMMNKLFVIRNMDRYNKHYRCAKQLMEAGCTWPEAAYIGASVAEVISLTGKSWGFTTYANTYTTYDRVADVRSIINNKYQSEASIGEPWGNGGGYHNGGAVIGAILKTSYTNSPTIGSIIKGEYSLTSEGFGSLVSKIVNRKIKPVNFFEEVAQSAAPQLNPLLMDAGDVPPPAPLRGW